MNKARKIFLLIRDIFLNVLSPSKVVLITEAARWSIYEDCKNIQRGLRGILKVRISTTPIGISGKILHFASVNTLITSRGLRSFPKGNRVILTWFHIVDGDPRIKYIPMLNKVVDIVHTSCEITKKELIYYGLDADKIIVIPLGVNQNIYYMAQDDRGHIRNELGVNDRIVVGSFQKDGEGWGRGDKPKLIKGPDIFCDVIERVSKKFPIHVLLTGPARGYVENRLIKAGIPYTHKYFSNPQNIAGYYRALDVYIISSRKEGGPKALLEAASCGVPVVATEVGMVPDIMKNGIDCLTAPVESKDMLTAQVELLLSDNELKKRIIQNGVNKANEYSLNKITPQYYDLVYKMFL